MQFDWATFAFQLVNLLVLFWLLGRFLFKPVAGIIAERRGAIDKALDEADAAKKAAQEATDAAESEKSRIAAERFQLLETARKDAEKHGKALLAQAKDEAAELSREAQLKLRQDEEETRKKNLRQAVDLAVRISGKLLENLPEDARFDGYPERLAKALSAIDDDTRAAIASGGDDVKLVAARPLTAAEKTRAQKAVAAIRPEGKSLPIEVDSTLIAGLELRSRHGVIHNSLAFDLERIAEAMDDGKAD